ncbi:MAG TPA: VOC family protein [Saprospiraceae bacterium]|nr:VOC family protein [Saprospiraceae bacterium]
MSDQLYPCLWFDGNAKEAATFYCSIFKDGKITTDTPMVVNFEIMGKKFMGLNAGPMFKFNEAISFVIECDTQQQIDYYWEQLTNDGGLEVECGWLKDKFGLSWQVVPKILGTLMNDPQKAAQVLAVIMKTKKFNLEELLAI